ncbi:TIM23 complex component [Polyrhizophydium stewartii]|uniref:Presequence translocated-associated motor subunit PAM17 n=1 Tax=Polyrhizophydium stewartii TaxID=2732419 RepID=A0ABR4N6D9_9FUNG
MLRSTTTAPLRLWAVPALGLRAAVPTRLAAAIAQASRSPHAAARLATASRAARSGPSSAAASQRPAAATSAAGQPTPAKPVADLNWTSFFALRKSRRNTERAVGGLAGAVGLFAGTYYFMFVAEFDPYDTFMGLDPSFPYMTAAMGVGVVSFASGLHPDHVIWRLTHWTDQPPWLSHPNGPQKEKEFHKHIVRHRPVNLPQFAGQSGTRLPTPPDYYGEKIFSLADYRKWIRRQRRFIAENDLAR